MKEPGESRALFLCRWQEAGTAVCYDDPVAVDADNRVAVRVSSGFAASRSHGSANSDGLGPGAFNAGLRRGL